MDTPQSASNSSRMVGPPVWSALLAGLVVAMALAPIDPTADFGIQAVLNVVWLALATLWFFFQVRGRSRLAFNRWIDPLVVAAIVWCAGVAWFSTRDGNRRSAMLMGWSWMAMGSAYLFLRQSMQAEMFRRAVCVLLIGVVGGLAVGACLAPSDVHGDGHVGIEEVIPNQQGESLNVTALRRQFMADWSERRVGDPISETAYLGAIAVPVGFLLLGICWQLLTENPLKPTSPKSRIHAAATCLLTVTIIASVAWHVSNHPGVESEGVTEATSKMAKINMWTGVGSGQFGDLYTQKRAAVGDAYARSSSNWWHDLLVAGGIPAVTLFACAFLAMTVQFVLLLVSRTARQQTAGVEVTEKQATATARMLIGLLGGAAIGGVVVMFMAWAVGVASVVNLGLMVFGGVAAACLCLYPWLQRGSIPAAMPGVAVLLWVGSSTWMGVSDFPALTFVMLLLLALQLSQGEGELSQDKSSHGASATHPDEREPAGRSLGIILLLVFGLLTIASCFDAVAVFRCAAFNASADRALAAGDRERAVKRLVSAVNSDSRSSYTAIRLALFLHEEGNGLSRDARVQLGNARSMAPHCSSVWWVTGQLYSDPGETDVDEVAFREAISFSTRALMLDPHRAGTSILVGAAWHRLGDKARAIEFYEDALMQDDAMRAAGRDDHALSPTARNRLQQIVGDAESNSNKDLR
ncbi:MAG: hypothetical protein AAGF97_03885 [Planctomycetota bacterium]